jgi:hypothetical protein
MVSGALRQLERHEIPDPVRSSAVDPRFQGVRQRAHRHDHHKPADNTVLVMLVCLPRSRDGPTGGYTAKRYWVYTELLAPQVVPILHAGRIS